MQYGGSGDSKERKSYLERQGLISCGHCRYNRGENSKRKDKPDKYKNINNRSIRHMELINAEDE